LGYTEALLSKIVGRSVVAGDIVVVEPDVIYMHDGTAQLIIEVVEKELKAEKLAAAGRAYMFVDHAAPAPHVAAATVHKAMRAFSRRFGIRLYDVGWGISHQVVVDEGIVRPGMAVIATDSHTPTIGALGLYALGVGSTDAAVALVYGKTWVRVPESYKIELRGRPATAVTSKDVALHLLSLVKADGLLGKSAEFYGDGLHWFSVDQRLTLTNMCTEMGAETAVIPPDEVTLKWLEQRGIEAVRRVNYAPKAGDFTDEIVVELNKLEPLIAVPPDVDNVRSVSEVEGVEVDQVFIGSCTNGRLEDLRLAAAVLKGRRVREGTRCIVAPASKRVFEDALREGIIEVLISAGCTVAPPTCGPCVGAHMGILASGEVAVSTTNRNFPGRMGHKDSKVFLASPLTAAAAAVEGRISDPRKYIRGA